MFVDLLISACMVLAKCWLVTAYLSVHYNINHLCSGEDGVWWQEWLVHII